MVKVGYDLHPSPLTPEESGWMIIDDSYETAGMSIYQDDDLCKPPRKIDGRQVGMTLANRIEPIFRCAM